MKSHIDINKGLVTFTLPGNKTLTCQAVGLPQRVVLWLTLQGIIAVLRGRANPVKTWNDIVSGRHFASKKRYPRTVTALAKITGEDIDTLAARWENLPPEKRRELQYNKAVRQVNALMSGDAVTAKQKIQELLK